MDHMFDGVEVSAAEAANPELKAINDEVGICLA
jgi:hypothetical protein